MLPSNWEPRGAGIMVRLGSRHDGGYVVSRAAVDASRLLISMGLNADWNFEADFARLSGARVLCFDGTVTSRFWARYAYDSVTRLRPWRGLRYLAYRRFFNGRRAEHRQLMIGHDGPGSVSLASVLRGERERAIFLKIDIEGSEYRILDQIAAAADQLTGVAIEFHDVDLHRERIDSFIASMTGFRVVHVHANNFGGVDGSGDPLVIELSMARADLCAEPATAAARGLTLDAPNNPYAPDIPVRFAPGALAPEVVA